MFFPMEFNIIQNEPRTSDFNFILHRNAYITIILSLKYNVFVSDIINNSLSKTKGHMMVVWEQEKVNHHRPTIFST